jgi:hypothetical protein
VAVEKETLSSWFFITNHCTDRNLREIRKYSHLKLQCVGGNTKELIWQYFVGKLKTPLQYEQM